MTAPQTVDVRIVWDDEAVSESRSEYLQHLGMDWADSDWSPARHFAQLSLLGELYISTNGTQLFVEPYEVISLPGGCNVLGLLLGLRLALDRVFDFGTQGVRMWPDWMLLLVESDDSRQVRVSSPSGHLLTATAEEWKRGLDRGLAEVRHYLGEHLPELRDDPVLGEWMNGADPVYFEGICVTRRKDPNTGL